MRLYNGGLLVAKQNSLIDDAEVEKRTINFSAGQNAVVIIDEDLTDLSGLSIPSYRQTTAEDLLVLPGSAFIGTLADPSNPATCEWSWSCIGRRMGNNCQRCNWPK